MNRFAALMAGLIFGAGLTLSGMVDPNQVLAFLNLAGDWRPNLIFVMGSAVVVTSIGYALVQRRRAPLFADSFHLPTNTHVDQPLVYGAVMFGAGWGIAGFCPGPAIVSTLMFDGNALLFLVAFALGQLAAPRLTATFKAAESALAPDG